MIFIILESKLKQFRYVYNILKYRTVNIANYDAITFSKFNNQLVFKKAYT